MTGNEGDADGAGRRMRRGGGDYGKKEGDGMKMIILCSKGEEEKATSHTKDGQKFCFLK